MGAADVKVRGCGIKSVCGEGGWAKPMCRRAGVGSNLCVGRDRPAGQVGGSSKKRTSGSE